MAAISEEPNKSLICEAFAVRQGQAFNPCTNGERDNAAIVDSISEGSQIETLDKVPVCEVWVLEGEGSADEAMLVPGRTRRSVPELVYAIPSPPLRYQHAVE
jgi:hypothetical protein